MESRVFHGEVDPDGLANALTAAFHRGNYTVQKIGKGAKVLVQISTHPRADSGGATSLSVTLQEVEDGVAVQIGKQAWLGLAASLGISALSTIQNPFNLIGRLDDIAQDVESLQLTDEVWGVLAEEARISGASFEISARLRRTACEYCLTANPVGRADCLACGAPLGKVQPKACLNCGFIVARTDQTCPNCGDPL